VSATLTVNAEDYSFQATATNTMSPLRDGVSEVRLRCNKALRLRSCAVDGEKASCALNGDDLNITLFTGACRSRMPPI
jgi:hypothetical protein